MRITALISFFFLLALTTQSQTTIFNGSFSIREITGSSPSYTVDGFFQSEGTYIGTDIQEGDRIYFWHGNDCDYLVVDTVYYAYANIVNLGLSDPDTTFLSIPTGKGLMTRLTDYYNFSIPFTADVPDVLKKCVGGKLINEIDQIRPQTSFYADSIFLDTTGLTYINDTVLQVALEQIDSALFDINDSLDSIPRGSGTSGTLTKWTGTNTIGDAAVTENATRLSASLPFRLANIPTVSLPGVPLKGDVVLNETVGNIGYYVNAWEYPVRDASSTGLGTPTHIMYRDANGRATGNPILTFNGNLNVTGGYITTNIGLILSGTNLILDASFNPIFIRSGGNLILGRTGLQVRIAASGGFFTATDGTSYPSSSTYSAGFGGGTQLGSANGRGVFFGTESAGVSGWNGGDVIFSLGTGNGAGRNGRVGFGTTTPQRFLHVEGEARITDLTTDTPTQIVGADADGDLGAFPYSLLIDSLKQNGLPDSTEWTTVYDNINIEPNPVFLYSIIHNPSSSRDWSEQIEIFDNILYYVPYGVDSLYIYDISSNTTYRELSKIKLNTLTANQTYIKYYDSRIFIYNQSGTDGEAIVDVEDPYNPVVLDTYTDKIGYGFDIKSNYLYAYLDTTIVVYDISALPALTPVDTVTGGIPSNLVNSSRLVALNDKLILFRENTFVNHQIWKFSLSNPANPVFSDSVLINTGANYNAVDEQYAYLLNVGLKIIVLDSMVQVGYVSKSLNLANPAHQAQISGDYLLVTESGIDSISIFNIKDRRNPFFVKKVLTIDQPRPLRVWGDRMVVGSRTSGVGLAVYDISHQTVPHLVTQLTETDRLIINKEIVARKLDFTDTYTGVLVRKNNDQIGLVDLSTLGADGNGIYSGSDDLTDAVVTFARMPTLGDISFGVDFDGFTLGHFDPALESNSNFLNYDNTEYGLYILPTYQGIGLINGDGSTSLTELNLAESSAVLTANAVTDFSSAFLGSNRAELYTDDETTSSSGRRAGFFASSANASSQGEGSAIWYQYDQTGSANKYLVAGFEEGNNVTANPKLPTGVSSRGFYIQDYQQGVSTKNILSIISDNNGSYLSLIHEDTTGTHFYDLTVGFPAIGYSNVNNYDYSTGRIKAYGEYSEIGMGRHSLDRQMRMQKFASGIGYLTHNSTYNGAYSGFKADVISSSYMTIIGFDGLNNNGEIFFGIRPDSDTTYIPTTEGKVMRITGDSSIYHTDYGAGNKDADVSFSRIAAHSDDGNGKLMDVGFTELDDSLSTVRPYAVVELFERDTSPDGVDRLINKLDLSQDQGFTLTNDSTLTYTGSRTMLFEFIISTSVYISFSGTYTLSFDMLKNSSSFRSIGYQADNNNTNLSFHGVTQLQNGDTITLKQGTAFGTDVYTNDNFLLTIKPLN